MKPLSDLAAEIAERPRWLPSPGRLLRNRPVRRAVRGLIAFAQRGRRGHAESDAWNADVYLCRVTAGVLNTLADSGNSWPGTHAYPEPEDWQRALRTAADALAARVAAFESTEDEARAIADAQQAMRWVADNLPLLWD